MGGRHSSSLWQLQGFWPASGVPGAWARIPRTTHHAPRTIPRTTHVLRVKILIAGGGTGGHLMPALALARVAADTGHEVVLVGATRGIEARVLPRHPFRFHLLPIEPLYRRQWWRNLLLPLMWLRATRSSERVLRDEQPQLVIGTGGYAAGPIVWRARQIHLGFPEARERLSVGPLTKVFVFGNPITPPGRVDAHAARAEFGLTARERTVFVFGGSQGARALNETVAGAIGRGLLSDVNLLWGTGTAHEERYAPLAVPGRIVVRGFFDPIATAYAAADLVIARAGAMTVSELCAWGKPSILVPLPTAAADHQTFNARALASAGAGVLLLESELVPESFAKTVSALAHDAERLADLGETARKRGHPNAARSIIGKALELLQV